MATWIGHWKFEKLGHPKNGWRGTRDIEAATRPDAEDVLRLKVLERLGESSAVLTYITVYGVRRVETGVRQHANI